MTDRPQDARSDADLMAAHATGDADAFGEVVRRHRDRLWAVALRTLGDREEAADAVQDALVSAFRASGRPATGGSGDDQARGGAQFRGDSAVTTWLHRIVVNACLDRVRRRASRPADPLPEHDLPARGPDPIGQRELALDLEAALATLPTEQRAALVLVDMYGWPVDDAAQALDCPVGTVKSRCARGRARLLRHLQPDRLAERNPTEVADVPAQTPQDPGDPEDPAQQAQPVAPAEGGENPQ